MQVPMANAETLQVRVKAVRFEADGVHGLELTPMPPLDALPEFTAGSHVDLHLPNGAIRSYSLLNAQSERERYVVGIYRAPESRGGSRFIHETLRVGDVLTIGPPRNNFQLVEEAPHSVFIAGGIGITPLLSMIRRLSMLKRSWEVHYAVRTRKQAAFLEDVYRLSAEHGQKAAVTFDAEPGGVMLDLAAIVQAAPANSHFYCCGPLPMLAAFEAATSTLVAACVHTEYFAAKDKADTSGGFTVVLAKSNRSIAVPAGQTILNALLGQGVKVPYSCEEGVCGTCEINVLSGTPDHRDLVLSKSEKAANKTIIVCCSGSKSQTLTLDL